MRRVRYCQDQAAYNAKLEAYRAEAAKLQAIANDLNRKRRKEAAEHYRRLQYSAMELAEKMEDKIISDRRTITAHLLKAILSANLAYAFAVEFQAKVKELTGATESDLTADMEEMVAKCKDVALAVDHAGTERHAWSFSDLIDELEEWHLETVSAKVNEIIERYERSHDFDKLY